MPTTIEIDVTFDILPSGTVQLHIATNDREIATTAPTVEDAWRILVLHLSTITGTFEPLRRSKHAPLITLN